MRTLRALRPLRAVSRWEGMRVSTGMGQQEVDHSVRQGQGWGGTVCTQWKNNK